MFPLSIRGTNIKQLINNKIKHLKTTIMEYNGYFIYPDKTGYAPKEDKYSFFLDDGEMYCGSGESIEDCQKQIDEL
jgi:hypothetical protein